MNFCNTLKKSKKEYENMVKKFGKEEADNYQYLKAHNLEWLSILSNPEQVYYNGKRIK